MSFPIKCGSLYTNRGEFAEYPYLMQALNEYATAEFIPQDQLLSGNLVPYLTRLLSKKENWPSVPLDGAEVAAAKILAVDRSLNRYHNVSAFSIDRPSSIYQT